MRCELIQMQTKGEVRTRDINQIRVVGWRILISRDQVIESLLRADADAAAAGALITENI